MPRLAGNTKPAANDVRPRTSHVRLKKAREDSPRHASNQNSSKTHAGAAQWDEEKGPRSPAVREEWDTRAKIRRAKQRKTKARRTNSGRDVIDHDVDQPIVTDKVRRLAKRITAAGHGVPRARNPRNDLYFLP